MSSTSSASECECDYYSYRPQYETTYNANYRHAYGGNPYYTVIGRPLVYYAQVPCQRNLTHCGRERERGNPNCFVKAFRWYTRDHKPSPSQPPMKPDLPTFAAWLDVKYGEYLQENLCGSEMYHVKLKQTFLAERFPTRNNCEKCAEKLFSENSNDCESCSQNRRPKKSRWTKKRRSKSIGAAAKREKSNQSCRFIMQPKDNMSRPPSLACHISNTTTIISDCTKKHLGRSQSLFNISLVIKDKAPCDVTPMQQDVCDCKPKGDIGQNNTCQYVNSKQSIGKVDTLDKNRLSQPAPCCNDTKTNVDVVQRKSCPRENSKQSTCKTEQSTLNRTAISQAAPCCSDTKTNENTCLCENSNNPIQKLEASGPVSCYGDTKTEGDVCQANASKPVTSIKSIDKIEVSIQDNANTNQPVSCDFKATSDLCQNNTCKRVVSKQSIEVEVSTSNKPTSQDFGCQYSGEIATKANAATQCDFAVPPNSGQVALPLNHSEQLVACKCEFADKIMQSIRNGRGPRECACKSLDTMPQKPMSRMSTNSSRHCQRSVKSKNHKNVECQYPAQKVVNIDAQTQYIPQPTVCFDNNLCECDFKGSIRCCQGPMQSLQMPSNHLPTDSCEGETKEKIASVKFSQTTSQTSNHSICLEEETAYTYPFFLKIVCADKLTNENRK